MAKGASGVKEGVRGKGLPGHLAGEARVTLGLESRGVHDDRIALDASIQIQVGAESGVEDRIVFQHNHRGFDSVERRSASGQNRPPRSKGAPATCVAGFDGLIGNVPSPTVNN